MSSNKVNGRLRSKKQVTCLDCDKIRTVRYDSTALRCSTCVVKHRGFAIKRGADNPSWKGGRTKTPYGYVLITLSLDSPYLGMARKHRGGDNCTSFCILEHRLVIAQHLGRCLKSSEIVHHINGIKDDNRLENLELLNDHLHHLPYTMLEKKMCALETRILLLEADNELLRQQVNQNVMVEQ